MRSVVLYISLMFLLFTFTTFSIKAEDDGPRTCISTPSRAGEVTFINVSDEVGLSAYSGNFFSWGDYDNDGYQDLLVDGKKLFRNGGPPSYDFDDQTLQSGISASVNSGVFGDYDNDGWLDIFCGGGRSSNDHPEFSDVLWHNERDGTFRKVPISSGIPSDTFPTVAGGWADMDRDGFIDLYMANYEDGSLQGYPDHFWMNNGDGTFTNATDSSGMSEEDHPYQGRGVSWCDFDNDGWQDAYVSNYRIMPNYLYRNLGNGTMEQVAEEKGVEGHGNLHPVTRDGPYYGHSLGSSWGDLDNDGDMDLWVTNLAHKDVYRGPICDDSYLFENQGEAGRYDFIDVRESSGIEIKPLGGSVTEGDELMVSSSLADYDNDGDLDLYIPQIYGDVPYSYSYLYQNQGDMTFSEVGVSAGIRVWNTYGSAWCDYNNDGWIDLVTGGGVWNSSAEVTQGYMIHLYRNDGATSSPTREWLEVKLHGRESNSAAIGTRVRVDVDTDGDSSFDLSMIREVQGGTGTHGQQDSMVLHFGLGEVHGKVSLTVDWPMGRTVLVDDVTSSSLIELYEPTDPIFLEMSDVEVSEENGGTYVSGQLFNPSDFDIDSTWFEITFSYGDEERSVTVEMGGVSAGIIKRFGITESGIPFEGLKEVIVEITRTYPPISLEVKEWILIDEEENGPPVPILTVPSSGSINEELIFDGSLSFDPNGTISSYNFDFGDGTGTGWTTSSEVTHSYTSIGNYSVTLDVADGEDGISLLPATSMVMIIERPVELPTAMIISIEPSMIEEDHEIEFIGEGNPSSGEMIKEYEWTSTIDGILSRRASFTEDDLSIGEHGISFRVKDSSGRWSLPAHGTIIVNMISVELPWVKMTPLPGNGTYSGSIMIKGTSGPEGEVETVEVRVDSDPWKEAWGTTEWEFLLDTTKLDPERQHVIQIRSQIDGYYSEIIDHSFYVEGNEKDNDIPPPIRSDGGDIRSPFIIGGIAAILLILVIVIIFLETYKLRKRDTSAKGNMNGSHEVLIAEEI